ncbi:EAL domain-containing response regulator [Pseudomonas sp. TTU2014-080ASC]|uniref:EAL domain-containing response regulator n=1 Tax=Pseudomonas sp. TTU2014-080ASC TaxID=1729724 RepID=UPI0007185248|nr:EAL domain-containing response regulator [Pseudomonas sp. TTU2014-080ASC]KRW61165.1 hypothetical protein AO726_07470 [Pseudomonas sp. TTU2014-080ASC]
MLDQLPELAPEVRQRPVLVIDDSLFQRELMCALLQDMGISTVLQAQDGQEALEMLRQWESIPTLIVDLEMPRMDGIQLLQCLADEQIHTPVIIASGRESGLISTVEGMLQANGMPLLGSLSKPVSGTELHRLLGVQGQLVANGRPARSHVSLPTEGELRKALDDNQIYPNYQPKIALQTGRVIGYEVLARWQSERSGFVSPVDFIPLACRSGLLAQLTFQLFAQALEHQRQLRQFGETPCMAINLDISLLAERSFAEQMIQQVRLAGSSPAQWILEVTESSLMKDPAATLASVGRLRLAGFGLSIDDYGTGFSTLKQLSRLPFTELKIDQAFVADAHRNARAKGILRSAIEMGRNLNLPCVAEGIENEADARLLLQLGCYAGQGYLFSRPMSVEALLPWHREHFSYSSLIQWFAR